MVNSKLAVCCKAIGIPCQARVMRYAPWTDDDGKRYDGFETIEIRFGDPFTNAVRIDSECFDLYRSDPVSFGHLIDDAIVDFMKRNRY